MDSKIFCVSVVVMLLLCVSLIGQVHDTQGLLYEIVTIDDVEGWQVSKGTATATQIVVPNQFTAGDETYPVIKVADYGFEGYETLARIDIFPCLSLTEIGVYAFKDCVSLPGTMLPPSIEVLGEGAFWGCTLLGRINVRATLLVIGDDAFYGCTNLYELYYDEDLPNVLPSTLTTIGSRSFGYCTRMTALTIPNSVSSLGDNPFVGCSDNLDLTFAPGNQHFSFEGNCIISPEDHRVIAGFSNSSIPSTIEIIGNYAFTGKAVSNLVLPETLHIIGDFAFQGCEAITQIELPGTLAEIGDDAFSDCTSLDTINIPNRSRDGGLYRNVILGDNVFANCTALTTVTLPESFTNISNGMFENCGNLTTISYSSSITSIGNSAFKNCTSLEEIDLPNTLAEIGDDAFSDCTSLDTINIPNRGRDGGVYRNADIGDNAFANCTALTTVTLPESFTYIGNGMFFNCSSLTDISFISNMTSIGNEAFKNCDGLTEIQLPNTLAEIGDDAFSDCSSLDTINIPNRGRDGEVYRDVVLGDNIFANCTALTSVTLPESFTTIGVGMFLGDSSLEEVSFSRLLTSIGSAAFMDCAVLPRADIHFRVATIGSNAFAGCSMLTIYTAFESQPAGWASDWNPNNRPVIWNALSTTDETESLTLTKLVGNYPNPFNPATSINFILSTASPVTIEIYNVKGQLVRTLLTDSLPAGSHTIVWNGENNSGGSVASGLYFYKMVASEYMGVKKMVMVK